MASGLGLSKIARVAISGTPHNVPLLFQVVPGPRRETVRVTII